MRDREFAERSLAINAEMRVWLRGELSRIGIPSDESYANFLLARFADPDTANAAEARLRMDGILVRKVAGYKLPHALRITIGDRPDCERVLASLTAFIGDLG